MIMEAKLKMTPMMMMQKKMMTMMVMIDDNGWTRAAVQRKISNILQSSTGRPTNFEEE